MPVIFFLDDRIWRQEKKYSVKKKNKAVAAIFFLVDRANVKKKNTSSRKKIALGGRLAVRRRTADQSTGRALRHGRGRRLRCERRLSAASAV